ncbi:unnamed protein product [Adineta steineri]|uniref:BSD domain-containing protein n=3 Tax=Adineta steineri TaxID=433720 RepID=A0A815RKP2_9BILA|nr:unnamed protein product [Adineta steineri]
MTSWFTSAIQTVRDKSADALEFVRKDLTEFTTTVKSDTETYIHKIKTQEVGDLGINRFVSKLSGANKTDDDNGKYINASPSFDRVQNELTRLQNDESTYLTDPSQTEVYEAWRETSNFNDETRKGEIAQLLIDAPHVRSFYSHLVPAQTTHVDFWSRYYFRLHQLEEEEARRTQLLRRAHEICSENNDNNEENNANDWDEPDEISLEEPASITQESKSEIIPVEHHEEQHQQQQQQQELTQSDSSFEKTNNERSGSDTVTGDSWEREFDETDVASSSIPSTTNTDALTESAETVTPESVSSSTTTTTEATTVAPSSESSSMDKKKGSEFDDEWESWS